MVKTIYSDKVVEELAKKVQKCVSVFPAFTADCLETIYEIGTEYQEKYSINMVVRKYS